MASPQKENGFVPIANEIVEALANIRISGEEMQCLWVILRKTYGWQKKEDYISLSQFSVMTSIKRPSVCRALKKLLSKKIIIIKNDTSGISKYSFNKNIDQWNPLTKKRPPLTKMIIGVNKNDNRVVTKKRHTKETITKETITKDTAGVFIKEYPPEFERFWELYPARNGRKRDKQKTAKLFSKLSSSEIPRILTAVNNYSREPEVIRGFAKDPATFMRNEWAQYLEDPIKEKRKVVY